MKWHISLLLITLSLSFKLYAQLKSDTVFIQKDSAEGTAQSIYFEPDRKSAFYESISWFGMGQFDSAAYISSLNYLREKGLALNRQNPVIARTQWITLKQYHGNLYVYHPCDFLFHYKVSFNDTTFIDWIGEGPFASRVNSQIKIDHNTYAFSLTGIYGGNRKLVISIIDRKKGIAIFEQTNEDGEKRNYLMIDAGKIREMPLIVNNCLHQKQFELDFEDPDFAGLLKPE